MKTKKPVKSKMERIFFVIFMSSCCHITCSEEIVFFLDPYVLSKKLQNLMGNSLKASEIQKHFDTFSFVEEDFGDKQINEIISSIGNRFRGQENPLMNSYSAIISAFTEKTTLNDSKKCCEVENETYNPHYERKVNKDEACYLTVGGDPPNDTAASVKIISDAFISNVKNYPLSEWQYFIGEESVMVRYPAYKDSACGFSSNVLLRQLLGQSYIARNYVMVFVIDISNATNVNPNISSSTLLKAISWVIKYTLGTIDSYDKIAYVAFNFEAKDFGGSDSILSCLNRTFTRAHFNARKAFSLLDELKVGDGRNYSKAISKAFEFFRQDFNQSSEDDVYRVMFFLSIGEPDDSRERVLETLKTENEKVNNSVNVFAYGFGDANFSVLEDMTTHSKNGYFFSTNDRFKLLEEVVFFFKHLPPYNGTQPIWRHPGYSPVSGEQKIEATLPVNVNSTRVGSLVASFSMKDILLEARFFRPNDFSYAFVIHKSGLIIQHPYFPIETTTNVIYIEATVIERDPEFLSVYESMKRGENGSKTFVSTKFVRTGIDRANSVKKVRLLTKYIWKKIPNSQFSVCLALSLNNTYVVSTTNKSVPPGSFLHDRMDLVPPKEPCVHQLPNKPLGSKDKSSVSLSTRAFETAEDYLFTKFTKEDILSIGKYMEGIGPNTFNIKKEAKQEVFMTYKAEKLWVNEEEEFKALRKNIARRFIGTKNGVFRIYPAAPIPKYFDPIARPWYIAAQAYPEKTVITLPYDAPGSNGLVRYIALCKAILINRPGSDKGSEVIGVMGAAFHVNYFYSIVRDLYSYWITSEDYELYITDTGGYIIVTEEYFNDSQIIHLTEREPQISSVLIQENIFKRVICARYEEGTWQRQYLVEFSSNQTIFRGVVRGEGESCYGFSFFAVPDTNAFILIRTTFHIGCFNVHTGHANYCNCSNDSNKKCQTTWENSSSCECPCTTEDPAYNSCTDRFHFDSNSDSVPPCALSEPLDSYTDAVGLYNVTELPICYEISLDQEQDVAYATTVLAVSLSALLISVLAVLVTMIVLNKSALAKTIPEPFDGRSAFQENGANE